MPSQRDLVKQVVLVAEVAVERALAHAGALRHVLHLDLMEPAGREQLLRRPHDRLAPALPCCHTPVPICLTAGADSRSPRAQAANPTPEQIELTGQFRFS